MVVEEGRDVFGAAADFRQEKDVGGVVRGAESEEVRHWGGVAAGRHHVEGGKAEVRWVDRMKINTFML